MQIPILVEQTSGERFIATGGAPFAVSAEAATADEALAKVKQMIDERVAHGAKIVSVELGSSANPWLAGAGMFSGDPLFDDWQQAITENRKTANEVPGLP